MIEFDVTQLNIFSTCMWMKHLGKMFMLCLVGGLVGLVNYAVWTNALLPGLAHGGVGIRSPDDRDTPVDAVGQSLYFLCCCVYGAVVFLLCWSYIKTMKDSPGTVPEKWYPFSEYSVDLEYEGAKIRVVEEYESLIGTLWDEVCNAQSNAQAYSMALSHPKSPLEVAYMTVNRPRWCKKCKKWKPPRSHHCSMQGRCILKMDHYCVWMVNTVGLLNYKSFVLFLFWTFVACVLSSLLLFKPCISFVRSDGIPPVKSLIVSFMAFVFAAAFSLALLGFLVMHGSLIFQNKTTIEAYEKKAIWPWPHDKGRWENIKDIFGANPRLWFLPIIPPREYKRLLDNALNIKIPLLAELGAESGYHQDRAWQHKADLHNQLGITVEYQ